MKYIFVNKARLLFALCCAFAVLTSSCIREDLDACPPRFQLTVKVLAPIGGGDATGSGELVTDASVYIFDENDNLLKSVKMSREDIMSRRLIELDYPAGKKIKAIAWGNVGGGSQALTEGPSAQELKVSLLKSDTIATSPDKLFHGLDNYTIKLNEAEVRVDTIEIDLAVGAMSGSTMNLPQYIAANGLRSVEDNEYGLILNKTLSVFNYDGTLAGDSVAYFPEGDFGIGTETNQTEWMFGEEYDALLDNDAIVAQQKLSVGFSVNGETIAVEFQDPRNGRTYYSAAKESVHYIVNFDGNGNYVGITAEVRPWGYVDGDIEW
ncbi:FimB/Mfa2 family fimbrial subunit [Parabacteroides sp. OttesenSCG-928-G07]|nr:FimB/Mfa2 family fimbrial subunit [Parabacteroides sp. OttesenSCG-928-G07]